LPTLNPLICPTHPVTRPTKAVFDGRYMVFQTIAAYAMGSKNMMLALSQLFQRPLSHAFLLPAAIYAEEELNPPEWRRGPVFEIGEQVMDEAGRIFEIVLLSHCNVMLRQITYTH
jgi:hypothetical protein